MGCCQNPLCICLSRLHSTFGSRSGRLTFIVRRFDNEHGNLIPLDSSFASSILAWEQIHPCTSEQTNVDRQFYLHCDVRCFSQRHREEQGPSPCMGIGRSAWHPRRAPCFVLASTRRGMNRLTLRSTRTQPWVAAGSIMYSSITSPLIIRLTVGPVNFHR